MTDLPVGSNQDDFGCVRAAQPPSPFATYPLLVNQTINLSLAPMAERVALVFTLPFREKVIDRLVDQRRAGSLFCLRQFVQLPELGVAEINRCPHPIHHAGCRAYAADLRPRIRGGAISASAGIFHSRCSFQAMLIVRRRFLVRMSDARCREPSRRPRSAWV